MPAHFPRDVRVQNRAFLPADFHGACVSTAQHSTAAEADHLFQSGTCVREMGIGS
jgi:hypothetical protein